MCDRCCPLSGIKAIRITHCVRNRHQASCRQPVAEVTSMEVAKRLSTAHLAVALLVATVAVAQAPAPGSAATAPTVGQMAPDFALPGATRFGLLKAPVRLSDFRGQT